LAGTDTLARPDHLAYLAVEKLCGGRIAVAYENFLRIT
jgi:hypothetical protein